MLLATTQVEDVDQFMATLKGLLEARD